MKKKIKPLRLKRRAEHFYAENTRVITQPFIPWGGGRVARIIRRVLSLPDEQVNELLNEVMEDFAERHRNFTQILMDNYRKVECRVPEHTKISKLRKLLLGAYFTKEYSVESAALFNPSIVRHPCQEGMTRGKVRFIMSLRATGEGHVSSIEFRSGVIDVVNEIEFDPRFSDPSAVYDYLFRSND